MTQPLDRVTIGYLSGGIYNDFKGEKVSPRLIDRTLYLITFVLGHNRLVMCLLYLDNTTLYDKLLIVEVFVYCN